MPSFGGEAKNPPVFDRSGTSPSAEQSTPHRSRRVICPEYPLRPTTYNPPMLTRRRFLLTAATAPALSLLAQDAPARQDAPPADAARPDAAKPPDTAAACAVDLPQSLQDLKDRRPDIHPLPVAEREQRLDLARELMKQYGLNAILVTTGASMKYFTGLDWQETDRFFGWVLPQSAAPFLIAPQMDSEWLNDSIMQPRASDGQLESVLPERKTTNFYLWQENEDPFLTFQRTLAESDLSAATIGVDEHTQFGFVSGIGHACPGIKLVSATPVTAGCRSLKSDAEIERIRLANHITFDVFKAAYLAFQPGQTTRDFEELVQRGYDRSGVEGVVTCQVGPDAANPQAGAQPNRKPQVIREGQLVVLSGGCHVDGYWASITRSFLYGKPTDAQRALFETVHNAQSAALGATGPGVQMGIPDNAARQVLRDAKFGAGYEFFTHRLGHGVGLDESEWPYLVQGNQQKMMAGMVFSNGPGIYVRDKFGLRLEDDMVVTDHGAELLLWQSPSLQDPFAIPAVLPAKKDTDATTDAKPTDTNPPDAKPTDNKPTDTPKPAVTTPSTPPSL